MTHQFGHLGLDVVVEDVPPLLEVLLGVSLQRSGQGLTLGIELDVPRLRNTDEVDDLHLVAVAEMIKTFLKPKTTLLSAYWRKNLGQKHPTTLL